ncbi:hypothetical protein [Flavobacterium sp.]|uniref:hypothetical protein n=1 Tax=Flavobacterium sp. TaxID=239 RepID=UPI0028BDC6A0|nr:hypothetical protein [Flavobacterium sp.]
MTILRILCILFFFWSIGAAAQVTPTKKDSTAVYNNLEDYSKKRKFTKFIHRLIFKPTHRVSKVSQEKQVFPKKTNLKAFEHKIIRNINIETLDPFGYSVDNLKKKPKNWGERTGNNIHIKSQKWTIRNYLLFKKNDEVDSLLIRESERLLEQQRFIRNVSIKPVAIPGSKDSVDIEIRALDSWSLIPTGSISTSQGNLEVTERNFLGIGHEFQNNFRQRFTDSENTYSMRYTIPNFKNTFISSTFIYDIDFDNNYLKGVNINRSFFSPYTRWAAGASFLQRFYKDSLTDGLNNRQIFHFKSETQDFWAGHSFNIFKGRTEDDRISNLVTTFRFANIKYLEKPLPSYDTLQYFTGSKLYLASIGITSRKYIETKYLFNNGSPEYIQIGKTYALTGGFRNKNNRKDAYFGGKFSFGSYYDWGYFSSGVEVGSYFSNGNSEQTTIRFEANYFTDLFEIGKWKLRQFVMPQLVFGENRIPIKNDQLNLGEPNGIQGFSDTFLGTKKLIIGLQTQTYVPGQLYGFRASPFINASFGMLENDSQSLFASKLYSKFGIGVLISNDYLVFNSFQISFAYYPTIPGSGDNLFKTNTFKNDDIRLPDFQIEKPYVIPFQ